MSKSDESYRIETWQDSTGWRARGLVSWRGSQLRPIKGSGVHGHRSRIDAAEACAAAAKKRHGLDLSMELAGLEAM